MAYSLKQAAIAIGKSKPTVLRAIQAGRISAVRDETTGGWLIDPAELHRVYSPVAVETVHDTEMTNGVIHNETVLLRREIEILREERERERQEAQTTITDLRRRLDTEAEERRRLTALLADRSTPPAAPVAPQPAPSAPPRSWWRWGRRE
jgi:hypothetical protein